MIRSLNANLELQNSLIRDIIVKNPESGVGQFFNAILDSGSLENIMSEDVVERMNLVVGPLREEKVVSFTAAFGDQVVSKGKVTVTWSAAGKSIS